METETLDHLAGNWRIFQLKGGHRFSSDDVLTAWKALCWCPQVERTLDLGCGIGSVGLLTLWGLSPGARLWGLEVQPRSLQLARKTLEWNGLQERVELRLGDLREDHHLADLEPFPLITGSPPYFPVGQALASPHPQRAAARMELHGNVFDYCKRAASLLSPEGVFVFVHSAADPRVEVAIAEAGLQLREAQEVYFRLRLPPTIRLFVCSREGERRDAEPFVIRDHAGLWTDQYLEMRARMGTQLRR